MIFLFVKKTLKQQKGEINFIFTAESKVLERSIVFVNNSKICALPITYINIFNYLAMASDCGVGGTSTGTIRTHNTIVKS
jgi:hypothetical protein